MRTYRHWLLFVVLVLPSQLGAKFIFRNQQSTINLMDGAKYLVQDPQMKQPITGTLQMDFASSVSGFGAKVYFADGVFLFEGTGITLTATLDQFSTYTLQLMGNGSLYVPITGPVYHQILVRGTNNMILGSPSCQLSNQLRLANTASSVIFSTESDFATNITMNGGSIILDRDFQLGEGNVLTGTGSVDLSGNNFILGTHDTQWTSTILWIDGKNIQQGATVQLDGQWVFDGDAHIIGNNNTLDLTHGGTLWIRHNTTLQLSNMTIAGWGRGSIVFENPTSRLELFDVTLQMANAITVTTGSMLVNGPSRVVTGSSLLTFNNDSLLTVDGTTLEYDTLASRDLNNIRFASSANKSLINGGTIRKVRSLKLGDFIYSTDQILDRQFVVSTLRKLIIDENVTIDGDGFGFQFARNPAIPIFTVAAGKLAKFTNILMKDIPVRNNSFGAGSQVIFGDQTTVEVGGSGVLNDTWMFEGQTVLNGVGNILQLGTGQLILRPGASVLIDNITIRGIAGNNIRCMDNNCTLSFGNVNWVQDDTFTLSNSHFEVLGAWALVGTSTFAYASGRASTITSFGSIYLDAGMTFSYEPPIANRDLIVMENSDALWTINNATLASTTTGMRLTNGTIGIEGTCWTINDNAVASSEGIALGNGNPLYDVMINFGSSATLNAQSGVFVYHNQE